MNRIIRFLLVTAMLATFVVVSAIPAAAATDCVFVDTGSSLELQGDCTTDATLIVPDGYTLDGNGFTITAVQPSVGGFLGAVVRNGGDEMTVTNVTVTTDGLTGCQGVVGTNDNRLRGVLFDGASGSITQSAVLNINRGASGCQEGNAIEVRNAPFDGSHPDGNQVQVTIAQNLVDQYQKTGILANGDVDVTIEHNNVGQSATQANLAANAIQIGFGGTGSVMHNSISGNSWHLPSAVATAVLLYDVDGATVSQNNFGGNADIGIYVFGDNNVVDNNRVFESGTDGSYDVGIGNYGADNMVTNNKVRGYDTPYEGDVDGSNKVVGSPNN